MKRRYYLSIILIGHTLSGDNLDMLKWKDLTDYEKGDTDRQPKNVVLFDTKKPIAQISKLPNGKCVVNSEFVGLQKLTMNTTNIVEAKLKVIRMISHAIPPHVQYIESVKVAIDKEIAKSKKVDLS